MGPERLTADKDVCEYDFLDPRYAEAYEEMTHYNEFASKEAAVIEKSETYEKIKQFSPEVRAVIASGFSENKEVQEALCLGVKGFIQKPYSMDQLGEVVKDALRQLEVMNNYLMTQEGECVLASDQALSQY